jgi:hypothetical protein
MEALLVAIPFALGLLTGRWWALLAAPAFGIWIGLVTEVEVPHWFLGAASAVGAAVPIAVGVVLRRANRADRG